MVEVTDQGIPGVGIRGISRLVGKLIANRLVGKEAIRCTLVRGWKPTGTTAFKALGDNIFLVEFVNVWDKARVLEGRPWIFEGNLFSVEDFNGAIAPAHMVFDKASFWVRIFHLPLVCMCETMGIQIRSSMGQVEEVETEEDGVGWGEYLWVRIRLDITKPLARGRVLKIMVIPNG